MDTVIWILLMNVVFRFIVIIKYEPMHICLSVIIIINVTVVVIFTFIFIVVIIIIVVVVVVVITGSARSYPLLCEELCCIVFSFIGRTSTIDVLYFRLLVGIVARSSKNATINIIFP